MMYHTLFFVNSTTLFFLNGLNPDWIETLVPGGWTVAVEMMFYLILPFLFTRIKTLKQSIQLFFVTTMFTLFLKVLISITPSLSYGNLDGNDSIYFYHWLPNQLPIFSLGFILFFLFIKNKLLI